MRFSAVLTFPLVLFSFGVCLKLPDYFTKCKFPTGFTECVLKNIQTSLPRIVVNGDKQFKINNLDPIILKQLTIQATPTLVVELTNVAFGDFKTMIVNDLQMDFKNNRLTLQYELGNFTINGKYKMDGHLLMLPISGTGDLTFACSGCKGKYGAKLTRYTEGGADYSKLSLEDRNDITPTFCVYGLTNLFGGDKNVGDQMVILLNQNWEELYNEAKPALSTAFSAILTSVINKFLTQVPVNELIEFENVATS